MEKACGTKENLFTGWTDVEIEREGIGGGLLKPAVCCVRRICLDVAFNRY